MDCDAAVVLLFNKENKFLVIKRPEKPNDPWSGNMALPGGHREDGESCVEAAIRECEEEVGIKPKIIKFLGIYSPKNKQLRVAVFLGICDNCEAKINENEVEKYFWLTFDDLERGEDCFYYKGYVIWGMTYRILRDFQSGN